MRKHAGSDHANELREFFIDGVRYRVERKATRLSGIPTGQTQGALRQVADEVLPSLDEISDMLREITDAGDTPAPLLDKLREARSNLGPLDILLREHFGITEFHLLAEIMNSPQLGQFEPDYFQD